MNDLIRREDILNLLDTALDKGVFDGRYDTYEKITDKIHDRIPSVEPEITMVLYGGGEI